MTAYSAFRADEEADTVAKTGSTVGAGAGYVDIVNTAWQSAILQKQFGDMSRKDMKEI